MASVAPPRLNDIQPRFRCTGAHGNTARVSADLSGLAGAVTPMGNGLSSQLHFTLAGPAALKIFFSFAGRGTCTASQQVAIPLKSGLVFDIGPAFAFSSSGPAAGTFAWSPRLGFGFRLGGSGFNRITRSLSGKAPVTLSGSGAVSLDLAIGIAVRRKHGHGLALGVSGRSDRSSPAPCARTRTEAAGTAPRKAPPKCVHTLVRGHGSRADGPPPSARTTPLCCPSHAPGRSSR